MSPENADLPPPKITDEPNATCAVEKRCLAVVENRRRKSRLVPTRKKADKLNVDQKRRVAADENNVAPKEATSFRGALNSFLRFGGRTSPLKNGFEPSVERKR